MKLLDGETGRILILGYAFRSGGVGLSLDIYPEAEGEISPCLVIGGSMKTHRTVPDR